MNYVIIGNGIAGIHAAETLRRLDPDSHIRMISDEGFPPYCRPKTPIKVTSYRVKPDGGLKRIGEQEVREPERQEKKGSNQSGRLKRRRK